MLSDEQILQTSRDIVLDYLRQINASVVESDGVYSVSFPSKYSEIFGDSKRIAFDTDVAAEYGCELAVPGSNILTNVLNEVRKKAPVVISALLQQESNPADHLQEIQVHKCNLGLVESKQSSRPVIRFYYNVTLKSITGISEIKQVDVDLETLEVLNIPSDAKFVQPDSLKCDFKKERVDFANSKAIETLEYEMHPVILEYLNKVHLEKQRDIDSINLAYDRRILQLKEDIDYKESKVKDFDRKIDGARTSETLAKHLEEKKKTKERVEKFREKQRERISEIYEQKQQELDVVNKRYRPVIEYSLIGLQVFSYSSSNCTIELTNETTTKKVSATFLPLSKQFTILCDYCNNTIDVIHLCNNAHSVCESCSSQCSNCEKDLCQRCMKEFFHCYLCKERLCSKCTKNCQLCKETVCNSHLILCTHCSQNTCFFCSDSCQICNKRFCNNAISICSMCNKRTCQADNTLCSECGRSFCLNDVIKCPACVKISCKGHSSICNTCNQKYGVSCMSKNICVTCNKLTEVNVNDSDVQNAIRTDPELAKYKKWEKSINNEFIIFKAKKTLGSKILVMKKETGKIIESRKGGLF